MQTLVVLAVVGLVAQLINSSLGMGYGTASTTFLLLSGTTPALASATVNLSQVGSQLASGIAHWRFGNVQWGIVRGVALPGAIGAFVGALFLSHLSTEAASPLMSGLLLALGLYILVRFTARGAPRGNLNKPLRTGFLAPLGLVAGFLNSTGGGGWGPIGTTALLASGRAETRKVIGSISTGEFAVVVAGSAGFAVGLGFSGINIAWVAVLLLGGLPAAPLAAWLARTVPSRLLGSLVGGLIVFTNVRVLVNSEWLGIGTTGGYIIYGGIVLLWGAAIAWSWRAHLVERAAAAEASLVKAND